MYNLHIQEFLIISEAKRRAFLTAFLFLVCLEKKKEIHQIPIIIIAKLNTERPQKERRNSVVQ